MSDTTAKVILGSAACAMIAIACLVTESGWPLIAVVLLGPLLSWLD